MKGYIYLAAPYSHPNPFVREHRVADIMQALVEYAKSGIVVYAPIVHWHHVALIGDLPKGASFWEQQDQVMLYHAAVLWVLQLEGWEGSAGVKKEIAWAEEWDKPVRYMRPDE